MTCNCSIHFKGESQKVLFQLQKHLYDTEIKIITIYQTYNSFST